MRFKFKVFFLVMVILVNIFSIYGLYSAVTGRNYSKLDWYIYETDNFKVIYSSGLKKIAKKAGEYSEQIYKIEKETLNLTYKDKYSIFITDADDIPNGMTVPFGYFCIWVNPSDYIRFFTGKQRWLKQVIGHEMVHALIMENTESWLNFFIPDGPGGVSRNIHEGFAQFYSHEKWGPKRGDQYLTLAVRNDNYSTSSSYRDYGRLLYAKGFSQIRYLKKKYPQKDISKLFTYRNWLGLYNFEKAFKINYDLKYSEFKDKWEKYINVYYNWREGLSERNEIIGTKIKKLKVKYINEIEYSKINNSYFFTGIKDKNYPGKKLYVYDIEKEKYTILEDDGLLGSFNVSKDSSKILYPKRHYKNNKYIANDLFMVDIKTKKVKQITTDGRVYDGVFYRNNKIICLKNDKRNNNVIIYDMKKKIYSKLTNFSDSQIYDIDIDKSKSRITFGFLDYTKKLYGIALYNISENKLSIRYFDNRVLTPKISDKNKKEVVFTKVGENFAPNIYKYNFKNSRLKQITNQSNFIKCGDIIFNEQNKREELIAISQIKRNKNNVIKIDANRKPNYYEGKIREYYRDWTAIKPEKEKKLQKNLKINGEYIGKYYPHLDIDKWALIPFPAVIENNISVALITIWSDKLLKNMFYTHFVLNYNDIKNSNYEINYINRYFPFTINIGYHYDDYFTENYFSENILEREEKINIGLDYVYNNGKTNNKNHYLSFTIAYGRNNVVNKKELSGYIENKSYKTPVSYDFSYIKFRYSYRYAKKYNNFPFDQFTVKISDKISRKEIGSDYNYNLFNVSLEKIFPFSYKTMLYFNSNFKRLDGKVASQNRIGITKYSRNGSLNVVANLTDISNKSLRGLDKNVYSNNVLINKFELRQVIGKKFMIKYFIDEGFLFHDITKYNEEAYQGFEIVHKTGNFFLAGGASKNLYNTSDEISYYWYLGLDMINLF